MALVSQTSLHYRKNRGGNPPELFQCNFLLGNDLQFQQGPQFSTEGTDFALGSEHLS